MHSEKTDLDSSPHSDALNMQPRKGATVNVMLDQQQSLGEPKHVEENRLECAEVPALAACSGAGMYGWMLRTAHYKMRKFR